MKTIEKMIKVCMLSIAMLGIVGCSTEVKNETIEDAYMSLYDGIIKKNDGKIGQIYLMNDSDKQQIKYNFAGLNLEHIEITNVQELYANDVYSLVAITSLQDYDVIQDKPLMEFMLAKKADDGYYFLGNGYIQTLQDEQFNEFMREAQNHAMQFQQSQEYLNFINSFEQFMQGHQQEMEQWNQQLQQEQLRMQNEMNMQQAQNAANEAMNQANQAANNNAPPLPIQ